jgi:hypothetical protein
MLSRKINSYFSLETYDTRKLAIFKRHDAYLYGSILKDHSEYRTVQRWMIRRWWQTGKNLKEGVVAKLNVLYQNVHEGTELNHDRHVRMVDVPTEIRKWKLLKKLRKFNIRADVFVKSSASVRKQMLRMGTTGLEVA